MFYINKVSGDKVFVTDTSDNAVDCFNRDELKNVMKENADLVIKGAGVAMTKTGLRFHFSEYKLSEADNLRLKGAKSPICKFVRIPNESEARNHYFCYNCNKELENKQATCKCGAKFIYSGSVETSKNYTVDLSGTKMFYLSVNGAKKMYNEMMLRRY